MSDKYFIEVYLIDCKNVQREKCDLCDKRRMAEYTNMAGVKRLMPCDCRKDIREYFIKKVTALTYAAVTKLGGVGYCDDQVFVLSETELEDSCGDSEEYTVLTGYTVAEELAELDIPLSASYAYINEQDAQKVANLMNERFGG